jgi:hypothetical protein
MCDYSLHHVKSRPAKIGDKLRTFNFSTGTRGSHRRMTVQRQCACFLERSLLFPRKCNAPPPSLASPHGGRKQ